MTSALLWLLLQVPVLWRDLLRLDLATPLHRLAAKYGVSGLRRGVARYMTQNLARDSPSGHVAARYEYAALAGDSALRDDCLRFMAWNVSYQFHSAPPTHMAKFFDVNCSLFVPRNYLSAPSGLPGSSAARDDRSTSFRHRHAGHVQRRLRRRDLPEDGAGDGAAAGEGGGAPRLRLPPEQRGGGRLPVRRLRVSRTGRCCSTSWRSRWTAPPPL